MGKQSYMSLRKWCLVFGVDYQKSRNTLSKWFRNQTIRNQHISPRYWRVHIEDSPAEYVALRAAIHAP